MKHIVTALFMIGCFSLAACQSAEDRAVMPSGHFPGEAAGEACARGVMAFHAGEDRASVVHVEQGKACSALVSIESPDMPVNMTVVEKPEFGTVQTVPEIVNINNGALHGLKWIYTPQQAYLGEDKFAIVYRQKAAGELKESRLTYFVKVQ